MRSVIMKQEKKKRAKSNRKTKSLKKQRDNEIEILDFITLCQMTKPVKTRGNENINISQDHNQDHDQEPLSR